jgi:outer membrane lipoprotein SlyB
VSIVNPARLHITFPHLMTCSCLFVTLLLAGCASTGGNTTGMPVLYPNAAYKSMGESDAKQHLAQCMVSAQSNGLNPDEDHHAVTSGAKSGAAIAGVTGAVSGLVFGRSNLNDVVKYGAQSAVVGAVAGGTRGAMSPQRPNNIYRQFVNRCVSEKGLEIIGWQ